MTAGAATATATDRLDESRWRSRIHVDGSRAGAGGEIQANLDAYTETQWVTAQSSLPTYPF
jgi:hypothetical protein